MAKFGCPMVSEEEITVAADALSKASNFAVQGQGARNLAYMALVAVRGAYFDEIARIKVSVDRLAAADGQGEKSAHG